MPRLPPLADVAALATLSEVKGLKALMWIDLHKLRTAFLSVDEVPVSSGKTPPVQVVR